MLDAALLSNVQALNIADRFELMEVLWETFPVAERVVTEAEKNLLTNRLTDLESNPKNQSTSQEVLKRLQSTLP
jgi:putative addiction module component (TIGR02574 family)